MSTFDDCLAFVLKHEGGNSDDPHDPGGRTSRGVTQRTYDGWRHQHGQPTQDVYAMTDSECSSIYEEGYYEPSHSAVLEPPIALYVFDMSVNMGIDRAVRILQASSGAAVDGHFGPNTLEHVTDMSVPLLVSAMHSARENYYRSLSNFDRYGKGWLSRNDDCCNVALSWVKP